MMGGPDSRDECRVLLFTPTGRDAALLAETISVFGIQSQPCGSLAETIAHIDAGCATLVIAEEALTGVAVKELGAVLDAQPAWSDLPVIVLTTAGEQTPVADYKLKMLTPLGNISLIERPVRPQTLVSIVQSALRARERQYQFRAQAKALQRSNEDLQRFANAASHDLQEPLRTIASYSQLLAKRNEGKLDEDSRLFLRYLLRGVDRMHTLIRDLLEFSRYTGGEYPAQSIQSRPIPERFIARLRGKPVFRPQTRRKQRIDGTLLPVEQPNGERRGYPCPQYRIAVIITVCIEPIDGSPEKFINIFP